MSTDAALIETPQAQRICVRCRWVRAADGKDYAGQDHAYCGEPSIKTDDGGPVPCTLHRFAKASPVMHICGEEGIFFEPR